VEGVAKSFLREEDRRSILVAGSQHPAQVPWPAWGEDTGSTTTSISSWRNRTPSEVLTSQQQREAQASLLFREGKPWREEMLFSCLIHK